MEEPQLPGGALHASSGSALFLQVRGTLLPGCRPVTPVLG